MDLILHLGAHRTGSTTFEKTLTKNADVLRAEGIEIWPPKFLRELEGFSLVVNARKRLAAGDLAAQNTVDVARETLHAAFDKVAASGAKTLLMSEENMLGTMHRNLKDRRLYATAAERLTIYADLLPQAPAKVALGVRSYADYWRSAYLFVLRKRQLERFTPELARDLAAQPLSWEDLAQTVKSVFPKAGLQIWAQEGLGGCEVQIAGQVLGRAAGAEGLKPLGKPANTGLNAADIDLIFRARNHKPDLANKPLDAKLAKMRANRGPLDVPALFTPAQEAQMADRYTSDMAHFAQGADGASLLSGPKAT